MSRRREERATNGRRRDKSEMGEGEEAYRGTHGRAPPKRGQSPPSAPRPAKWRQRIGPCAPIDSENEENVGQHTPAPTEPEARRSSPPTKEGPFVAIDWIGMLRGGGRDENVSKKDHSSIERLKSARANAPVENIQ